MEYHSKIKPGTEVIVNPPTHSSLSGNSHMDLGTASRLLTSDVRKQGMEAVDLEHCGLALL